VSLVDLFVYNSLLNILFFLVSIY